MQLEYFSVKGNDDFNKFSNNFSLKEYVCVHTLKCVDVAQPKPVMNLGEAYMNIYHTILQVV